MRKIKKRAKENKSMENQSFSYRYSAKENKEVESIRRKYMPREIGKMEELKRLDRRVSRPADVFAYIFGSIGAVVMGCGMSLVMTDIASSVGLAGDPTLPGIAIGVVGMVLTLLTYPIHKAILKSRRRRYASEVLALSETIASN